MPNLDELKNKVVKALDLAGYDVAEGKPYLWGINGCANVIPAFGNCFGNNPAAPYIVPLVPHRKDEDYAYGESMQWGEKDGDPLFATYRLREDEAILMFGEMPPPAAYLGYEPFLFTRYFDVENITSPHMDWQADAIGLQHQLSPNPDTILYNKAPRRDSGEKEEYTKDRDRVLLFANLGPTINRRVLERQIGEDFWGQQAILSTSADASFEARLNAALEKLDADLPRHHAHAALGADLKMGLTERDDDFWSLMRYAVPTVEEDGDAWRNKVEEKLVVLRVAQRDPKPVLRHRRQEFEEKSFNTDERALANDLQKVANAVHTKLDFGVSPQEISLTLSNIPLHGPFTVPRAMNNLGATHDTDTYRLTSAREFGEDDVFAIVGVNHTVTENATYVSLGVYNSEYLTGLHGVSQGVGIDGPLNDSVQKFFELIDSDGMPDSIAKVDLSKFYVHILAREGSEVANILAGSDVCSVILTKPDDSDNSVIQTDTPIRVSQRGYLNPNPAASCGADPTRTLSPILLSKRPQKEEAKGKR